MKMLNINDFKYGFLIGNFDPSLIKTKELEVGIKFYKARQSDREHYHKISEEYSIVIQGRCSFNGHILSEGDIAKIERNEKINSSL